MGGAATSDEFSFDTKRLRVPWDVLSSVDPEHVAQATDIDALERVLHLLCHGDFDHATAPTHDLTRVIHLAQLALQYLVFVQNQLATENAALRTEDHGQRTMQLRVAELKQRLALTQHELKRYRKTTKTYEYLASAGSALEASPLVVGAAPPLAAPQSPDTSPHIQTLRGQLADAQRALEEANRHAAEAQQREATHVRAAAAKEQAAADAARRLQAHVQRLEREARVQSAAGDQLTALQQQWQEAVARQQALEQEKDALELELLALRGAQERDRHALSTVGRLERQLQEAHGEVRALQDALAQQRRRLPVAQGGEAEAALRAQVASLEDQLRAAQAASTSGPDWRDAEIERLRKEVQRLAEEASNLKQQRQMVLQRCAAAEQEAASLKAELNAAQVQRTQQVTQPASQAHVQPQLPLQPQLPWQPQQAPSLQEDGHKSKKTLLGKLSQGWGWRGKGKQGTAFADPIMLTPQPILQSLTQQPLTQQPLTQQPLTQQPVAQQPLTQQPVTQQPLTQQPLTQQPLTQQPVTQQPLTQQPVAQQPLTQQPVTQQPLTQQPLTQQPLTQQPVAQQSPTQSPSSPMQSLAQPQAVTVVDLWESPPKAAGPVEQEFTIAADWGGMEPTAVPAPPLQPVGPLVDAPASKHDDLFDGFSASHGGSVESSSGDRTLKPVRSIIKSSSFAERGLQKSPSGRRVAFNLPE